MLRVDENDVPRVIQEYLWAYSYGKAFLDVHFTLFNQFYFTMPHTHIAHVLGTPSREIEIAAKNAKLQWEIINEPKLQEYILENYFEKP